MNTVISDLSALKQYAGAVLSELSEMATGEHATILALSGELGAGKTAFTKLLAEALGVTESVPSPTFVIAKFYDVEGHPRFKRLIHADMYRVDSIDELRPLGWEALLSDAGNLLVIEWPERIKGAIPTYAKELHFQVIDKTTREIRA